MIMSKLLWQYSYNCSIISYYTTNLDSGLENELDQHNTTQHNTTQHKQLAYDTNNYFCIVVAIKYNNNTYQQ